MVLPKSAQQANKLMYVVSDVFSKDRTFKVIADYPTAKYLYFVFQGKVM